MMKQFFIFIFTLKFTLCVQAQNSHFCKAAKEKVNFQFRMLERSNRIDFKNTSKISPFNWIGVDSISIGACWWLTRLQRAFIYLAVPRPLRTNEKPMSQAEIKQAIYDLKNETNVVELRGYSTIQEFSKINKEKILDVIRLWQLSEVALGVVGLTGSTTTTAQDLESKMHELYRNVVHDKKIVYQMIQFPTITSHAWLVTAMKKSYENNKWVGY